MLGAALATEGEPVAFVSTPGHAAPRRVRLDDVARGTVEAEMAVIDAAVDVVGVLWVTVKAPALDALLAALRGAPRLVVPLLNGIDHVAALRARFGAERVVAASIGVEAERLAPGHAVRRTPFCELVIGASAEPQLAAAAASLRRFGFTCHFEPDETTLLWRKLTFLAPFALATTAADRPVGGVAGDPEWYARYEACARETAAVALACGARVDPARPLAMFARAPREMRSSMQKDVDAGRAPELDAIAGPILREGERRGLDVSATRDLVRRVEARL
jgi:2-dehydropantoate 2-reductase